MNKSYISVILCLIVGVVIAGSAVFNMGRHTKSDNGYKVISVSDIVRGNEHKIPYGKSVEIRVNVISVNKKNANLYLLSTLKDPKSMAKITGYMSGKMSNYSKVYKLLSDSSHTNTVIVLKGYLEEHNSDVRFVIADAKKE